MATSARSSSLSSWSPLLSFQSWRHRWLNIPREARDALFLIAVMAWTIMPHFNALPLWCSSLTAVLLLWRAWLAWTQKPLPKRPILVALLIVCFGLTWFTHHTILGSEAGVTLLVVLTALKTMELRARRDAFVMFSLGFFLILTQFFNSQALSLALAMFLSVWGLLTGLVLAHMPVGRPSLWSAGKLAAKTALLGAPIMVVLFMLFPRIAPLWGVPDEGPGKTGLSNSLQMGQVSDLVNDDSIAMRVKFLDGKQPPSKNFYFRGPVLTRYQNDTWTSTDPDFNYSPPQLQRPDTPGKAYELTLEPNRLNTVPMLEMSPAHGEIKTSQERVRLRLNSDGQWLSNTPITERIRIKSEAFSEFTFNAGEKRSDAYASLELPGQTNPRTRLWVQNLQKTPEFTALGNRSDAIVDYLLRYIRQNTYSYTLSPGRYAINPIDQFWLDQKSGFCEHYAASFVFILRMLGIPSRIVTGYQGAEYNTFDQTWVVRQRFAHAWVEYWTPDKGWIRVDPTGAIAPNRIENNEPLTVDPGFLANAVGQFNPSLLSQVRNFWDAVNNRWDQWILNYSNRKQSDLFKNLGFDGDVDWRFLLRIVIGLITAASLIGLAWAWWDQRRKDPWLRAWDRVLAAAQKAGLSVPASTAPHTLASLIRSYRPWQDRGSVSTMADQIELLAQLRYGRSADTPAIILKRKAAKLSRDIARQIQRIAQANTTP